MPLYVYALVASAAAAFEAAGQRIDFLPVAGLFAAATPMDARPPLTEAALRDQHDIVGAIARRVDAVLPARFGSLVDRAEIEQLVKLRHEVIAEALELVRGREQMTIRVFGVGTEEAPVPRAPAASGTAYLRERKAAGEWAAPAGLQTVRDTVRHLVAGERVVRGEGRVAGTIYHLVPRGASVEYARLLEVIRTDVPDLPFIVSGPWPPFAFAPELWA